MRPRSTVPLLAVAAAVLGACSGPAATGAEHAASPGPSAAVLSPGPSAAPDASRSAAASPPESGSGSQSRCHTDELRVSIREAPGGGAAGSMFEWLVFTNGSGRTCTMYGFPGVSWVTGDSGQQVNDPAVRMTGVTPQRLSLAPGQAAHATLQSSHPQAFADTCTPVEARGLRVYPPDETAAVFVAAPRQVCSTKGVGLAQIGPVNTAAQ